jgi:hypothetical protein
MIDYTMVLNAHYSDSQWTLNGDDYSGLIWLSDSAKPSKSTLDGLWDKVQNEITAKAQANASAKSALLAKLGITQDEAKLLLS